MNILDLRDIRLEKVIIYEELFPDGKPYDYISQVKLVMGIDPLIRFLEGQKTSVLVFPGYEEFRNSSCRWLELHEMQIVELGGEHRGEMKGYFTEYEFVYHRVHMGHSQNPSSWHEVVQGLLAYLPKDMREQETRSPALAEIHIKEASEIVHCRAWQIYSALKNASTAVNLSEAVKRIKG